MGGGGLSVGGRLRRGGLWRIGKAHQLPMCKENLVQSDSPELVDFAIKLVIFVLNLPDRQVLFLGEIQITEGL